MSYRYYIQRAAYEESEAPEELFFSEAEWRNATNQLLGSDPSLEAALANFSFQDGYATFLAEDWTLEDPRVALACQLARQLEARVFGEEDEEYPTQS